jgi:thiamine transport system permease protein
MPISLQFEQKFGRLIESLNISRLESLFKIEIKENATHLISAFVLGFGISISDFTAVLLLSGGDFNTVTTLLFQLMGAYRYGAAALVSVILLLFLITTNYLVSIPLNHTLAKNVAKS